MGCTDPNFIEGISGKWIFTKRMEELTVTSGVNQSLINIGSNYTGSITVTGSLNDELIKINGYHSAWFFAGGLYFYTDTINGGFRNYLRISEVDEQTYIFFFKKINSDTLSHIKYTPEEPLYYIDFNAGSLTLPTSAFYSETYEDTLQIGGQFQFNKHDLIEDQKTLFRVSIKDNSYIHASRLNFKNETTVCLDMPAGLYEGSWCGNYLIYGDDHLQIDVTGGPFLNYQYEVENDTLIVSKRADCDDGEEYQRILWIAENPNVLSYCIKEWVYYVPD